MDVEFCQIFSYIYWDDHIVFVFCLCTISCWLICICWTILVNLGWIPFGHAIWSFLYVVGFSLLIFCGEFCHLYSSKILSFNFLFGGVSVWFWYQDDGGLIECHWECFLLLNFLEELVKDWYKFFVYLVKFTCETIWSWTSVCWKFCNKSFNFNTCDLSVHIFYFVLIQSWDIIPFQRIYPFLLGCLFYWYIFGNRSCDLLCFCGVHCNFSFFVSNFIYLSPLPFFLDESS